MGRTNELGSFLRQLSGMMRDVYSINKRLGNLIVLLKGMASILPLAQLYLVKALIDMISQSMPDPMQIVALVTLFAGIQLINGAINQYANHLEQLFSQEVADVFSLKIIQKASLVSFAHFENPAFHNNLHLAQQQARFRIIQLLPAINASIANALSLVFLVLFFVSIKAYFFLALFVLAIPISLNKWLQGKRATDLDFKLAPKERESSYLFQLMTGIQWAKELRTYHFGQSFQKQFQSLRAEINQRKNTIQQISLRQNILAELLEVAALGLAIGYLALKTISHAIGLGTFVLYMQGIQRMQTSAKAFFQSLLQVFQLRSFVKDLYGFFELSEEDKQESIQDFPQQLDQLKIESLSFGYPNQNQNLLNNITLEASKGQIIAIVGENGSGKSTLVKLLAGFYTPDDGHISLNGIPLKEIRKTEFYKISSFFFQD
jgi:ATP-binding cassette subfamily B protein